MLSGCPYKKLEAQTVSKTGFAFDLNVVLAVAFFMPTDTYTGVASKSS